jgi:signal transduction histidine kinase
MRWLPALRAASALLFVGALLLVVVTIHTMAVSRRWMSDASNALMGFSLAERTLQVDLLDARAGLLRNYDPVDADIIAARENLLALDRLPKQASAVRELSHLRAIVGQHETLVERFKSDNALLQNSLSLFRGNPGMEHRGMERGVHEALASRILSLTLDTTPQTVAEARAALARAPMPAAGSLDAQLVSHARLLIRVLPEIDDTLRSIRALQIEEQTARLQAMLREDSVRRAAIIRHEQAGLAVTVLLLVGSVIALVILQRWRTRELEAQAANERLSAAIALPLIETGSASFASRVQTAVERLAPHIGTKRLQLSIPGLPNFPQISWPDENDGGWLARCVAAADADQLWVGDRLAVSRRPSRDADLLDHAMGEAGVENLVLLRSAEPFRVIIGFEPEHGLAAPRRDHAASIGSAIVAIAHGARREAMQIERERLERSLARARRLEAMGTMASGVAHNFNNIIGAIGGFAELGQERTRAGSVARNSFEEIQAAVRRARDLVEDILGFARQRRSAKQTIDLAEVLRDAVRLLTVASRDQEGYCLKAAPAALPVRGVARDLEQAIINICNNGAFASGGKLLTIAASREHLAGERQLSHARLEAGDYAVISIRDQGPGVPEHALPRLFEPFYTTKAVGTGLGLSTAWEIIQDHGGSIDVRNRARGGACFSIWIPETRPAAEPAMGDGSPILLIAEETALAAEEELLAEMGYEPLGFALSAPLAVLREAALPSDVILISSPRARLVEALIHDLTPELEARTLLVATQGSFSSSVSAIRIDHPLHPSQLSRALSQRVGRERAGIAPLPV